VATKSDEFFRTHPVFTLGDFRWSGRGTVPASSQALVKYHLRRGRLKLVERGLYAVVPPGTAVARFTPDPILVAAALRDDAVLGYHSALELLGLAHSVYHETYYLTATRRKDVRIGRMRVRALLHPKRLRDKHDEEYGTEVRERQGVRLRVTTAERTLVDCLATPRYAGGLEEALQSLGGLATVDVDRLLGYLDRIGQRRLYAAVGFFLEREARRLFVPPDVIARLERERPGSPTYLDRGRKGGRFLARWNLVVPRWAVDETRVEV
jgi:predicted transcriptional regulator of viral defense system